MSKILSRLIKNIGREKFLSASNVIVMTITLILLGIFVGIMGISQTGLAKLQEQAQVTIFFNDDFPEEKILDLKGSLESDPRILAVDYISKDDAFRLFSEMNKDEPILLESISANILPASLEIKAVDLSDLAALATEFEDFEGVEEVKFFKDIIENFRKVSNIVMVVGFVLVVAFFAISYAIIMATLRVTINAKGTELSILKLVGATDNYIKKPLILQGMLYSAVAAVIASIFLSIVFVILNSLSLFGFDSLISFTLFSVVHVGLGGFMSGLVVLLVLSSVVLGYLGSVTAIKRYLKY